MRDFFRGAVTKIIDASLIEMRVTQNGRKNSREYNSSERIRVKEVKPFLIAKKAGYCTKSIFESLLLGKEVTCLVNRRNAKGQIEGDLFLL